MKTNRLSLLLFLLIVSGVWVGEEMSLPRKYPVSGSDSHLQVIDWNNAVDILLGFTASGTFITPHTYTLSENSGTYYLTNAYQIIDSGADVGAIINTAIASGDVAIAIKGKLTIGATAITIPDPCDHVKFVAGDATAEIDNNAGATAIITFTNSATTHDLIFDGIKFTNFTGNAIACTLPALVAAAYNITVQNCEFSTIGSDTSTSVVDIRATKVLIENNRIISDGVHGWYAVCVRYANDSAMINNFVDGTAAGLVFWRTHATAFTYRNIMAFNTVQNTFGTVDESWAIVCNGGNSIVAFNRVYNTSRSGIIVAGSADEGGNIVIGNTVKTVAGGGEVGSGMGIWVHGVATDDREYGTVVSGNTVDDAWIGICINYETACNVSNNNAKNCHWYGIYVTELSDTVHLSSNVVYTCNT